MLRLRARAATQVPICVGDRASENKSTINTPMSSENERSIGMEELNISDISKRTISDNLCSSSMTGNNSSLVNYDYSLMTKPLTPSARKRCMRPAHIAAQVTNPVFEIQRALSGSSRDAFANPRQEGHENLTKARTSASLGRNGQNRSFIALKRRNGESSDYGIKTDSGLKMESLNTEERILEVTDWSQVKSYLHQL